MKSLLLLGALALSLAANVWLATSRRTDVLPAPSPKDLRSAATTGREVASPANTQSVRRANPALAPVAWRSPNSEDALRALVTDLRTAGFPAKTIRVIVEAMLREQMQAGFANLPFWQRLTPNKEIVTTQQAAARDLQAKLEQILGPDGRQSVGMDPVLREQRYGIMSDEKLESVLKIERDYQDMQVSAGSLAEFSPDDFRARQKRLDLLAKEKLTDLASLLTPAELEAYELRNSEAARRIQAGVREIAVSDEEYATLFRLQKAADATNPRGLNVNATPEQGAKWQAAQLALHEQMRAVLPDDRFYKFLEGTDPIYLAVARFAEKNSVTAPATSYQVYQLQTEARATIVTLSQQSRGAGGNAAALAELASKLAAYNARLNALLGPQVAAAYRKQPTGRIFNPPARPSPPPAPTPSPGGG